MSRRPPHEAEVREPLSYNQEFAMLFDKGDDGGAFGPRYNVCYGWKLQGRLDIPVLAESINDVIERHEALRTTIQTDGDDSWQRVHPTRVVELMVEHETDVPPERRAEFAELRLQRLESGEVDVRNPPLVRALLVQFDETEAVLYLVVHHTAADGWALQVIARDIGECYEARREGTPAPGVENQYRDFSRWQRAHEEGQDASTLEYWKERFGSERFVGIQTDHPRSLGLPQSTAIRRYLIPSEVTHKLRGWARRTRSTPFLVAFSVYLRHLSQETGATDITLPTLTSGRVDARHENTVGSMFNFMPVRIDLTGAEGWDEAIARTRSAYLEAVAHETAFLRVLSVAPHLPETFTVEDEAVCAFQFHAPHAEAHRTYSGITMSGMQRRVLSQDVGPEVPDGALLTLDVLDDEEILASIGYNVNLFAHDRMEDFYRSFEELLVNGLTPIDQEQAG